MSQLCSPNFHRTAAGIVMVSLIALTLPAQNDLPPESDVSELVLADEPETKPQVPAAQMEPVQAKPEAAAWDDTPLRDPFWPVGYFPNDWQRAQTGEDPVVMEGAGWKAAAAKIRIGGTSMMDGKTAAIVNGKLKVAGDLIEVTHEGRSYQWQISSIEPDGQIHLKKQGVK